MKRIIEEIEESVRIHGYDGQQGLGMWLDYLVDMFDVKYIVNGTYDKHLEVKAKEDEHLFNATILWLEIVSKGIESSGWIDVFGNIYEEMYQSKGKSSMLGQFFTPEGLCTIMAKINGGISGKTGDPACGSGRTLLAAYTENKSGYYVGEDIDGISCKMCALNLMVHGARGRVICHDTIASPVYFNWGYEINEVRYPIPTPFYSLRLISNVRTDEEIVKIENKVEQLKLF